MRVFTSIIELRKHVPEGPDDLIVQHNYLQGRYPKAYYWNDGAWVEKKYWTLAEAVAWVGETKADVLNVLASKYPHLRPRFKGKHSYKIPYTFLAPIKHMIEQTKSVHA